MNKTRIKIRSLLLLLLMMIGVVEVFGQLTMPYYKEFESGSTDVFTGGDIASGTNVQNVLRVTNTAATASFSSAHTLHPLETVSLSFIAYHGYLNQSSTSSVAILNSDNQELISYTYDHNSSLITDVRIGGSTASGFSSFKGCSYYNTQAANGLVGNGRPYLDNNDYNPNISLNISGNGSARFTFWRNYGEGASMWRDYNGSLGSLKLDIKSIRISSNCTNSDRTICINNFYLHTNYYANDYESGNVDWTTKTAGRYTPVILEEEGGNHYLSVKQDERNNNGTTLSSTSLGIPAGTSYQMTFDLKVSSRGNDNNPSQQADTKFTLYDASNAEAVFSLTANGYQSTAWKINDGMAYNLPGTCQGSNDITTVPWYTVSILRAGSNTWVTIKDKYKSTNPVVVENLLVSSSATGGIGKMEFVTSRYYANFAIDNVYVTPILDWSSNTKTVDITEVGITNPNTIADLPTITVKNNDISSYSSSNTNVAYFPNAAVNSLLIKGVGTATITATDVQGYTASYILTVNGTSVTPTHNTEDNTLTFDQVGLIANNTSGGGVSHTLNTGLQIDYGYAGETAIVVEAGMGKVLKIIDANGYSHPNITANIIPSQSQYGGTFIKLTAIHSGYLTVSGNVSTTGTKLYKSDGTLISSDIDEDAHTLMATLTGGAVYFLYTEGSASSPYTPLVHSINYSDPLFVNDNAVIEIPVNGQYTIPSITGMTNPTYTLTKYGDLISESLSVSGNTINGITKGGAILVKAEEAGATAYHLVTVAYKATEYPGHLWNFNEEGMWMTTSDVLKAVPTPTTTVTDGNHNSWTARYKNEHNNRAPEWRLNRTVNNDNAVIVPETAGLLFNAGRQCFYLKNDDTSFKHIGIYNNNTSFTIPFLKTGDIVELNWKHDASGSGSEFSATNLKDLRNKPVSETFLITESAERNMYNHVGRYSFIVAADGDVTFTLMDAGYTDILSVRIYKGPYQSTMRYVNAVGNVPAETTMLLDNQMQDYAYNYCNQLNSTATGPAIYVLKGYRSGVDDVECVTGTNAALSPTTFVDDDATYPAYPVDAAESARLYELRKNLIGFRMFNETWQSRNNSYNNGHIQATSGWGKVTIRMNNYTNDMKYVIGYTPDYTLTIGSAPHQTYPYTWDFTKIAGGMVTGDDGSAAKDYDCNVLYSIEVEGSNALFSGQSPTNWIKKENGQFLLNTDNSDEDGAQYVPGAVLVTTERALSNYSVPENYSAVYAKDELDGLGFSGDITMHIDHLPTGVTSGWNRTAVADRSNSLLSFKLTDYATFTPAEGTEIDEHIGTWSFPTTEQDAGNGKIQLSSNCHIDESTIPAGGIGYRLDDGDTKFIKIIPSSALQVGDIISVTTYNAYNNRDAGVSFNKTESKTDYAQYEMLSRRMVEETINYTVVANDGLDGRENFYIYKRENTVHVTAVEITRSASAVPDLDWSIYTLSRTTITVPDLNADGKQDWIYVSASAEPESVTNATKVTEGTDGPDAKTNVYKYKVTATGNALLTFASGTKIYKIGVTHILKEIHPVGGTGWATEIRNQDIDHELTGYFTKNDVNAYTVKYDSYDLNTATVALTPINEDGYVPKKTGIVMRLDNASGLTDANSGKNVPLFYPSYTRPVSSTPVDFPDNNLMYQDANGIDDDNMNGNETYKVGEVWYQKFILTNIHWAFHRGTTTDDEQDQYKEEDAAGFYRMHIWGTDADKNVMPAHTAFMLVPENQLPVAVWRQAAGTRNNTIGIRDGEDGGLTDINEIKTADRAGYSAHDIDDDGLWYTLSGMKLSGPPTKAGIYIHHHRKVVIK